MSKRDHRENTVGPWAEAKLSKLEKYLRFYCQVMQNQRYRTIFLDGFAGAPTAKVRTHSQDAPIDWPEFDEPEDVKGGLAQFILGSPHRALQIERGFDFHYFFDLDDARVEMLRDLQTAYPDKHIDSRLGDANALVKDFAARIKGKRNFRGVAFLDPYGPQLEWGTVAALAATETMEVLINFPAHMALNRLLCISEADRRPEWEDAVSKVIGGDEWRPLVYPERVSLFGDSEPSKIGDAPDVLTRLYQKKLQSVFKHVAKPALITNTRGAPLYYLIWAGQHRKGMEGAEYILGDYSRLSKKALAAPIGNRSRH